MKILHTADWHIGKTLYKQSLREEISLFFDWLLNVVDEKDIDIILVSGDIFDLANPANVDKELFYKVLSQLRDRKVQCVITAGNHDSPSLLEAPRPLFMGLNIHMHGFGSPVARNLLTMVSHDGKDKVHILAVPFLREGDLRKVHGGESYEDKVQALRTGIINHYKMLKDLAVKVDDAIPIIAMGHLYIQGARISDSERDIHIGNQAGLPVDHFQDLFDYSALGHIHRPQRLNKEGSIRYSGSPIPLSFSERKDKKQVLLIETKGNEDLKITELEIPLFRPLVRIKGKLQDVRERIHLYRSDGLLPAFIEIVIIEKERDQSKILETVSLAEKVSPHYEIINYRIQFEEHLRTLSETGLKDQIEDLNPRDVFLQRIDEEALSGDDRKAVIEAFGEVYESIV